MKKSVITIFAFVFYFACVSAQSSIKIKDIYVSPVIVIDTITNLPFESDGETLEILCKVNYLSSVESVIKCSSQAQTLLTIAGLEVFEPEFIMPMEDRFLKLNTEQENHLIQNFSLNDLIEVYPTPASSEIWVEYLLTNDNPATKIEIFNIIHFDFSFNFI